MLPPSNGLGSFSSSGTVLTFDKFSFFGFENFFFGFSAMFASFSLDCYEQGVVFVRDVIDWYCH